MSTAAKGTKPGRKVKLPATKTIPAGNTSARAAIRGMSKTAIWEALAEKTGLTRKEAGACLDALTEIIAKELGHSGPGVFTLPGICKLKTLKKPAVPARTGVDPFTKQTRTFKAKEARTVFKAMALKALRGRLQ